MNPKDVTIYDIAKEAGVSPATVSRVLTKNARVSPKKQKLVESLIQRYNFRPNAMARGLSDTKSKTIGIIAADIRNQYYSSLAVECELAASERGYMVLLCNALNNNKLEDNYLEKLYEQRVDVIIQLGCRVDDRISDPDYSAHINRIMQMIPVVITGKLDGSDCYVVDINSGSAMKKVMDYLTQLGHKRIALIGGQSIVQSTYDKQQTLLRYLREQGIVSPGDYILESEYDSVGGYRCIRKMWDRKILPSAVIAVNDYVALGAIKALSELGLRIPADISLASFDNTSLSKVAVPSLTTIDYHYAAFGKKLVDTAIRAAEGDTVPKLQHIETKLVVRDSCGTYHG